jgi:ribosomal-protein-alanine N-acetyltransferase
MPAAGGEPVEEEGLMQKALPDIPSRIETERLYLRPYAEGDGRWYYPMSQKNLAHLSRYESENPVMAIRSEREAENLVRSLAVQWAERRSFFLGAFDRSSDEFVAQVFVGPVSWELPEFQIGYFVDKAHEGRGYVSEAVRAALGFVFQHLHAGRVRLECDDTNARSIRVAERCGMVREGHLRQNKKNKDGTLSGTMIYGLLKSEFAP